MSDKELDETLQKAITSVLDVKPKDPIRFLASHFRKECNVPSAKRSAHLLHDLTIFHPVIEDRVFEAYHELMEKESGDGAVTGEKYTKLLMKLVEDIPLEQVNIFFPRVYREDTECISFSYFRNAVMTAVLFKQFFMEVDIFLSKIGSFDSPALINYSYTASNQIDECLKKLKKNGFRDRPLPYTLGIQDLEHDHSKDNMYPPMCKDKEELLSIVVARFFQLLPKF